jgi:hypothetical protein
MRKRVFIQPHQPENASHVNALDGPASTQSTSERLFVLPIALSLYAINSLALHGSCFSFLAWRWSRLTPTIYSGENSPTVPFEQPQSFFSRGTHRTLFRRRSNWFSRLSEDASQLVI